MYENNYLQAYVFLYTLYGGIIIGIVYDIIDVLINGHVIKKRSLTDILFWAIAFAIIIGILFYVNNITIRSYVFLGFGLGWFLYFYILSGLLRKVLNVIQKLLNLLYIKILKIVKILFSPIVIIHRKSKNIVSRIKEAAKRITNDFKKYKRYFDKSR